MEDSLSLAKSVDAFLRAWCFENWYGLNPGHEPFSANSRQHLYTVLKCCVPALDGVRDPNIADAVSGAGYRIVDTATGVFVEEADVPIAA